MAGWPDNCIDNVVTDPPYNIGFMGKSWDNTGIAYNVDMWREVLRILKPGAHLLAFGGSRTYHRMACAIEDAGFEIRDMVEWIYGSGFPKSLDISKAIDKQVGAEREVVGVRIYGDGKPCHFASDEAMRDSAGKCQSGETTHNLQTKPTTPAAVQWSGWGTALKPAHEPVCLARKPISEKTIAENVLKWGTGGINVDGCRVGTNDKLNGGMTTGSTSASEGWDRPWRHNEEAVKSKIVRCKGQVAKSESLGRFPANLIHDGSDGVVEMFPQTSTHFGTNTGYSGTSMFGLGGVGNSEKSSGSAARFFYCAKASKAERDAGLEGEDERQMDEGRKEGNPGGDNPRNRGVNKRTNFHPTVKPIALMKYLIGLITPPPHVFGENKIGGYGQTTPCVILDMFAGSGSTLVAAKLGGWRYIGIEIEKDYVAIAEKRLKEAEVEVKAVETGVPVAEQKIGQGALFTP
jgi:site-specific DNA-methyltransferase (adenine-specific)